jgi:hypothetical protein
MIDNTAKNYVRQENNFGAIINTDNEGLKAYKMKKHKENEINTLKNEVHDLKNLVAQLIEKLNK